MFIDAITTIFSFAVLFFSQIRGYHQLALFSILCLLICLIFSLLILPLFLTRLEPHPTVGPTDLWERRFVPLSDRWRIGLWLVATTLVLVSAFSVSFESDVKKLDGAGRDVLQAEQRFRDTWGGGVRVRRSSW